MGDELCLGLQEGMEGGLATAEVTHRRLAFSR
jgi:hypothetical protein